MTKTKTFRDEVAKLTKLWNATRIAEAFAIVDSLRSRHPSNPQVLVMWASLLQLLDESDYSLDDAKSALREAVDFDDTSPAASIELGHYLDAMEDNPKGASHSFARAIVQSKELLFEALVGNAKALLQIGRRAEAMQCVLEALQLSKIESVRQDAKSSRKNGATTTEIDELIDEIFSEHLLKTG